MEETTALSDGLDLGLDLSNFSIKDVSTVLYKIADICRMIIDALKSFIKPILKMGFDAMAEKAEG